MQLDVFTPQRFRHRLTGETLTLKEDRRLVAVCLTEQPKVYSKATGAKTNIAVCLKRNLIPL